MADQKEPSKRQTGAIQQIRHASTLENADATAFLSKFFLCHQTRRY